MSRSLLIAVLLCAVSSVFGQEQKPEQGRIENAAVLDTLRQLQQEVRELRSQISDLRSATENSRAETAALRHELQVALANEQSQSESLPGAATAQTTEPAADLVSTSSAPTSIGERIARLEEQFQLLSGQTSDLYQTKVESSSRYRIRLSGIALFNLGTTRGGADDVDIPALAEGTIAGYKGGSTAATMRQSQIGLEVVGPEIAGAKTRGNVQFDFAGGFPQTAQGVTFGIMRLRTATVRLDWAHTSVVAGQDAPFLSPLSPTSFAALATPALSYSGNLWTWIPQVRIEHRRNFTEKSSLLLQAGIFDSLSGQAPLYFYRAPQAGEASRQPGYGARVAWTQDVFGHPLTVGTGGYYSRQNWGFGRNIDGWASTADWSIPLGYRLSLSGEFFRGRAIGGLGGALDHSVVSSGPVYDSASQIRGLDVMGGWSQLKFKAAAKVEFNVALGQDNPFASETRQFPFSSDYIYGYVIRNRTGLFNVVFRPRSNLVLSAEYRHLRSFELDNSSRSADHLNLAMGILF